MGNESYFRHYRTKAQPALSRAMHAALDQGFVSSHAIATLAATLCEREKVERDELAAAGQVRVDGWVEAAFAAKDAPGAAARHLRNETIARVQGRTTLIQLANRLGIAVPAYCTKTQNTKQRTQCAEALKIVIGSFDAHDVLCTQLHRVFRELVDAAAHCENSFPTQEQWTPVNVYWKEKHGAEARKYKKKAEKRKAAQAQT